MYMIYLQLFKYDFDNIYKYDCLYDIKFYSNTSFNIAS